MLRIDVRREDETIVVQVEGRVAGPWVEELRRVLESSPGHSPLTLDLTSVGYVDATGERLLRRAVAGGARIRGRSTFVAALLDAGQPGETP